MGQTEINSKLSFNDQHYLAMAEASVPPLETRSLCDLPFPGEVKNLLRDTLRMKSTAVILWGVDIDPESIISLENGSSEFKNIFLFDPQSKATNEIAGLSGVLSEGCQAVILLVDNIGETPFELFDRLPKDFPATREELKIVVVGVNPYVAIDIPGFLEGLRRSGMINVSWNLNREGYTWLSGTLPKTLSTSN